MIVLDASVLVDFLLQLPPHAEAITERIRAESPDLAVPYLLDVEVAQVLRRFVLRGEVAADFAKGVLADLRDLPLVRYPHAAFLEQAFELRENVTVYDAVYLVLAEALDATLVTRDRALAGVPGYERRVEVIGQ